MASLNMKGPFVLSAEQVDKEIRKGTPGNYAYGYLKENGRFVVQYVGRSDTDLNDRIKHGIGNYKLFKYSYAANSKEAFEKECKNYHDFGGWDNLNNELHPGKPDGSDYSCPICDSH